MNPNNILSVTLHISGTIHHMNFIYGTYVLNEHINTGIFLIQNFYFPGVVRG